MKKLLLLVILSYTYFESPSQSFKHLKVGDLLPDLEYNDVWNYKTKNLRTSDFRGKLLILDFWSITCGACIKSMPKMEKLQNQYAGKLQILMVTSNSNKQVSQLARSFKQVRENNLPFINGDTILNKLFYFETVPTHVWINETGKVIHITEGWDTNDSSITSYLKGENPVIAEKYENEDLKGLKTMAFFDQKDPFRSKIPQYSFFTSMIEGGRSCSSKKRSNSGKGFTQITFVNDLAINMILYAYSEFPYWFNDLRKVSFIGEKAVDLMGPRILNQNSQWRKSHFFSYRLKVPENLSAQALKFMQQDLERFFDVDIQTKKQNVKCLVLVCKNDSRISYSKGGDTTCTPMDDKLVLRNSPIDGLVNWLNYYSTSKQKIPLFFNEAKLKGNVDLEFNIDILTNFDLEGLKKKLKQFGLELIEEDRMVDMLVISDQQH